MWLSSGGTSGAIHIDEYHNINCLLAGRKELTLVDAKWLDVFPLDHSYLTSSADVDAVNMTRYEELQHIPTRRVVMRAGDCVYIPIDWVHGVRSWADADGRNLAVNLWWERWDQDDLRALKAAGGAGACPASLPELAALERLDAYPKMGDDNIILVDDADLEDGAVGQTFRRMRAEGRRIVGARADAAARDLAELNAAAAVVGETAGFSAAAA